MASASGFQWARVGGGYADVEGEGGALEKMEDVVEYERVRPPVETVGGDGGCGRGVLPWDVLRV